jgi:hypothetical protein
MPIAWQQGAIRLIERVAQGTALDRTSVDEKKLLAPGGAVERGTTDQAPRVPAVLCQVNPQKLVL